MTPSLIRLANILLLVGAVTQTAHSQLIKDGKAVTGPNIASKQGFSAQLWLTEREEFFREFAQGGNPTLLAWVVVQSAREPALLKAGISAPVGWHTLRHSFGTLMKANGEDLKTIQELLRHATFKVTADTYTQAVTPVKRDAHAKVAKLILADVPAAKPVTPTIQ